MAFDGICLLGPIKIGYSITQKCIGYVARWIVCTETESEVKHWRGQFERASCESCVIDRTDLSSSARLSVMSALNCCCCASRCLATDLRRFRDAIACTQSITRYPRDAMLARVFATATCLSVCPSVCHTPVLCLAERKQDREVYTVR